MAVAAVFLVKIDRTIQGCYSYVVVFCGLGKKADGQKEVGIGEST